MTPTLREQVARVIDAHAWSPDYIGTFEGRDKLQAEALAKADAIIALLIPPGYVVVPVEPTEAMIEAGLDVVEEFWFSQPKSADIYRAMLSARPAGEDKP